MRIVVTIKDFKVELEDNCEYSVVSNANHVKEIISLAVKEYNSIENK